MSDFKKLTAYEPCSVQYVSVGGTSRVEQPDVKTAKLQEMVRILAYCMSEDRDCDRCTLNGGDMPTPIISACDSLPDRLREVGVKVS